MGNYSEIDVEILYPSQLWSGVKAGNFLVPANYKIPNFCSDCPLTQEFDDPQISNVAVNAGIFTQICEAKGRKSPKLTGKELFTSSILVLNDEGKPTVDPVYLGDIPWVDPLASLEKGASILLGKVHEKVDGCSGPQTKKKFMRDDIEICGAGLLRLQAEAFDLRELCGNTVESARVAAESPRSEDDIKPEPSREEQDKTMALAHLKTLRATKAISNKEYQLRLKKEGLWESPEVERVHK